jgi:hypothetical protein
MHNYSSANMEIESGSAFLDERRAGDHERRP